MAALTKIEQHLLRYPPTLGTWKCEDVSLSLEADPAHDAPIIEIRRTCGNVNSARMEACWVCGTPKPEEPKLMWPLYVAACKKAGIEPSHTTSPSSEDAAA